jgi:phage I-like protein
MPREPKKTSNRASRTKPAPVPDSKETPKVSERSGKTLRRIQTELSLSPIAGSAAVAGAFAIPDFGASGLNAARDVLREATDKVKAGDLSDMESMLAAQTIALNAVFSDMAWRAAENIGKYLPATETYLRLALKAQAQCRVTVEALAEIKNPRPVAFVKQANIAQGRQQVNNRIESGADPRAHAGISANRSNELLGVSDGERLESGAARAASVAHPELEAVGVLHGAENRQGEGN